MRQSTRRTDRLTRAPHALHKHWNRCVTNGLQVELKMSPCGAPFFFWCSVKSLQYCVIFVFGYLNRPSCSEEYGNNTRRHSVCRVTSLHCLQCHQFVRICYSRSKLLRLNCVTAELTLSLLSLCKKVFFFFLPMPPHVLMNVRGFPPGCGDSVADF